MSSSNLVECKLWVGEDAPDEPITPEGCTVFSADDVERYFTLVLHECGILDFKVLNELHHMIDEYENPYPHCDTGPLQQEGRHC